jgi:hypothetical protein
VQQRGEEYGRQAEPRAQAEFDVEHGETSG